MFKSKKKKRELNFVDDEIVIGESSQKSSKKVESILDLKQSKFFLILKMV